MTKTEQQTFLLLGSNQGDRATHLAKAREALTHLGSLVRTSAIYLTKAWGDPSQPDHYNQCVEMTTALEPTDLMRAILAIEMALGRKRQDGWQPRTIDIDILFYGHHKIQSEYLTIPHIRIPQRNFVLVPMMEIAPHFRHPLLLKTIEELYLECPDHLEVLMLENDG